MNKEFRYYVYLNDDTGEVTRVAKIGGPGDDYGAYGWENGGWKSMPGLLKIENDITDYRKVTEGEAMAIVRGEASSGLINDIRNRPYA